MLGFNFANILEVASLKSYTGGPRNLRTFYLRVCLFAVIKNVPKFSIRRSLTLIPSLICGFWMIFGLKLHKKVVIFSHTVLPHYLRFQNLRHIDRKYLQRITRAANIADFFYIHFFGK